MYENGKQLNRYANKMIHKRKQKDNCRRKWFGGLSCSSWEDYKAHAWEHNNSLEYWKTYYLSGPRKFARDQTNSALRRKFRDEFASDDYENMYAPQCAEYQKFFDYAYSIW